jgi:hypothetical protein
MLRLFVSADSSTFLSTYCLHTGACFYYVANIRAAFRLCEPMFYTKDAWIALFNEQSLTADNADYDGVQYSAVPRHNSSAASY